jgi:hypothetical protein
MKKNGSILLAYFLVALVAFSYAAELADPIYNVLKKSFKASNELSYCCAVTDTALLEEVGAASGKYYHLVLDDGFVCRRIDLFDNAGKLLVCFTQNREGSYAFASGKWGKIAEILPLYYYDLMCEDFDEFELSLTTFSKRIIQYRGQNCTEITMKTKPDAKAIQWGGNPEIPIFGTEGIDNINSRAYATRPMKRVFIINCDNQQLLVREHYNLKDQLLYRKTLDDLALNVDLSEKDFKPTGKIVGDFLFLNFQFMKEYYGDMYKSRLPKNIKTDTTYYEPSLLERLDGWLFDSGKDVVIVWILRVGGIICLAIGGVILWRRKHQ